MWTNSTGAGGTTAQGSIITASSVGANSSGTLGSTCCEQQMQLAGWVWPGLRMSQFCAFKVSHVARSAPISTNTSRATKRISANRTEVPEIDYVTALYAPETRSEA